MKTLILILIPAIFLTVCMVGCRGKLDITPKEQEEIASNSRDFNFMFRFMNPDSSLLVNDTLKIKEVILIELYLSMPGKAKNDPIFSINYVLDSGFDANLVYQGDEIRSGDWLDIPAGDFENKKLYVHFIPLTPGRMTLTFQCQNQAGVRKTFKRQCYVLP